MKTALVIGASGGIGAALVQALSARGVQVTGLSRSVDGFDITDESSVADQLSALVPHFDLIFVASGALAAPGDAPEKTIKSLDPSAMAAQFAVNAIGPALVLKHALRLLPRDSRSVIAVLTARVGSIGDNKLGGWYSYRASKAAANQIVRTAAVELARTHRHAIAVALHPGTVATDFTRRYLGRHPAVSASEAADNLLSVIDALTPDSSGTFLDYSGARVPW
ncbi:MAG: SDR family NAD(P)-dependent oxidoreductase [Pseudomonadota bacterium]